MTRIEWTDTTWNPIVGCTIVSPGCTNCYAMRMAGTRLKTTKPYNGLTQDTKAGPVWTGEVRFLEERLTQPLKWRKPRRVFVNSMGDLFHEDVPYWWIDRVFAVMAETPRHTYQVLTKRPERMQDYFRGLKDEYRGKARALPAENIWLGTSVEDQKRANERIPALLDTPATVHFISAEPLLGPVDLTSMCDVDFDALYGVDHGRTRINWVICGGESGPSARPMEPDWARSLRDQCQAAGVAFFMKQMPRKAPIPDDLMVREYPS